MNSKKGGKQNRSQALDLGFSDLLGQSSTSIVVDAPAPPVVEATVSAVPEGQQLEDAIPVLNPDFALLVAAKDWRGLSEATESQLGAEEKDPEARLLWIVAQLELSALPPFLLTPSYESVIEASRKSSHPELHSLAQHTGAKLRHALRRLGEEELADSLPQIGSQPQTGSPVELTPPLQSTGARRRVPVQQLALLTLAVVVCTFLMWGPFQNSSEGIAVAALLESPRVAAPIVPLPPRLQLPSQLSALMYEIEGTADRGALGSTGSANQEQSQDVAALSMKAPLEPSFIGALRRGEGVAIPASSTEGDSGRREVDSQPRDIFGSKSNPSRGNGTHMVQHFSKIRVYVVVAGAPVFSAASHQGAVLEELPPGAKVKVEGLEGEWLRLVSKSGRTGFIRRSDAEIFDPSQMRTRS